MQNAIEQEYKVLMTHTPALTSKGGQRSCATLLGFPDIVEEAFSREQTIKQIKVRIADILTHSVMSLVLIWLI